VKAETELCLLGAADVFEYWFGRRRVTLFHRDLSDWKLWLMGHAPLQSRSLWQYSVPAIAQHVHAD